jgi:uncharacterized protein (TIGR02145 family)
MKNILISLICTILVISCSKNNTTEQIPTVTQLPSIKICNQTWTSQNLSVNKYQNGETIPEVKDPVAWNKLTTGAWCWYNFDSTQFSKYGRLYNWFAVNDSRKLAPQGWHIPTISEWSQLFVCLGGEPYAGGKMKVSGTSNWAAPNTAADNSSGFNGLPGGHLAIDGVFYGNYMGLGFLGYWWASDQDNTVNAPGILLRNDEGKVTIGKYEKRNGYSVRFVRD